MDGLFELFEVEKTFRGALGVEKEYRRGGTAEKFFFNVERGEGEYGGVGGLGGGRVGRGCGCGV